MWLSTRESRATMYDMGRYDSTLYLMRVHVVARLTLEFRLGL